MKSKYLHIASFSGNVGDIINHEGFYDSVGVQREIIEQIEIRKFYNNSRELKFDNDLLERINNSRGLILGGGGFFDVRWKNSNTGTTVDLSSAFIDGIKVPVLVNSMGVHVDYGNKQAIESFKSFIQRIDRDNKWLISLRNDGSLIRLKAICPDISDMIISVPDNGFMHKSIGSPYNAFSDIVGLSITNDLFSEEYNGNMTTDRFNKVIVDICKYILSKGDNIRFFLHAPQDIEVLHTIYSQIGNSMFRNRITISHFDMSSIEGANKLEYLYTQCKYVIAMRFHGNVIALKNMIPTIGLAGHEQIEGLYTDINFIDNCVVVRDGFENRVQNLIDKISDNRDSVIIKEKALVDDVKEKHRKYVLKLKTHLNI